ncbi:MAG: hypothetical protein ACOYO1_02435 [Bacteroidales bacterium]
MHFFDQKPFSVEITTSVLGTDTREVLPFINGKNETLIYSLSESEDVIDIILNIENKIELLKIKFSSL